MTNTAEVSTTIDAPADKVWAALTDPSAIEQYFMGAKVKTDWKVGSPITWTGEWNGKQFQDKGEIMAFDANKQLSFSHWSPLTGAPDTPNNYHAVTITLQKAGAGTRIDLAQANLNGKVTDADRKSRADFEKNWSGVLEGLKNVVENRTT